MDTMEHTRKRMDRTPSTWTWCRSLGLFTVITTGNAAAATAVRTKAKLKTDVVELETLCPNQMHSYVPPIHPILQCCNNMIQDADGTLSVTKQTTR